jgi:transcriptional regulator with XRE-family HTH domain
MHKFGNLIREKREEQEMLLRHLSAKLDIDVAVMSKIERGEKLAKREFIEPLSKIFNIDYDKLTALWLADQVYEIVENEEQGLSALKVAEKEIKYTTKKQ